MDPISGPEPGRPNGPALTSHTHQRLVVIHRHATGFDVGFDFERASFAVGFHVLAFHSFNCSFVFRSLLRVRSERAPDTRSPENRFLKNVKLFFEGMTVRTKRF